MDTSACAKAQASRCIKDETTRLGRFLVFKMLVLMNDTLPEGRGPQRRWTYLALCGPRVAVGRSDKGCRDAKPRERRFARRSRPRQHGSGAAWSDGGALAERTGAHAFDGVGRRWDVRFSGRHERPLSTPGELP